MEGQNTYGVGALIEDLSFLYLLTGWVVARVKHMSSKGHSCIWLLISLAIRLVVTSLSTADTRLYSARFT